MYSRKKTFQFILLTTTVCLTIFTPHSSLAVGRIGFTKAHQDYMDLVTKRHSLLFVKDLDEGVRKKSLLETEDEMGVKYEGLRNRLTQLVSDGIEEWDRAQTYLARLLLLAGKFRKALNTINPLVEQKYSLAVELKEEVEKYVAIHRNSESSTPVVDESSPNPEEEPSSTHTQSADDTESQDIDSLFQKACTLTKEDKPKQAIVSLKWLLGSDQKKYSVHLLQGLIHENNENYSEALSSYRKSAKEDKTVQQQFLEPLILKPYAFLDCLEKNRKFSQKEMKLGEDNLKTQCKEKKKMRTELQSRASRCPRVAYIYASYLIENIPTEASSNSKKSVKKKGNTLGTRRDFIKSAFDYFALAARGGHKEALARLEAIVIINSELRPPFGRLLEELGHTKRAKLYLGKPKQEPALAPAPTNGKKKKKKKKSIEEKVQDNDPLVDLYVEAEALEKSGKKKEAQTVYKKMLADKTPEHSFRLLNDFCITQRNLTLTQILHEHATRENFNRVVKGGIEALLGDILLERGSVSTAIGHLQTASLYGSFAAPHLLAYHYLNQKNEVFFNRYLNMAVRRKYPVALFDMARIVLNSGDTQSAAVYLEEAANSGHEEALNLLQKMADDPKVATPIILLKVGKYFLIQEQLDQAQHYLQLALASCDDSQLKGDIHYFFSHLAKERKQFDKAIFEIKQSMQFGSAKPYAEFGFDELMRLNYAGAANCFHKALEIDATNIESLYNLGVYYFNKGDLKNSFEYLTRGLSLKDADSFYKLKVLADTQNHSGSLHNVGVHYLSVDMPLDAIEYFSRALKSPSLDETIEACAYYHLSLAHFEVENCNEACKYARLAFEKEDPDILEILYNRKAEYPVVADTLTKLGLSLIREGSVQDANTPPVREVTEKLKYVYEELSYIEEIPSE